jgi:SAM-dependent methyltransferase
VRIDVTYTQTMFVRWLAAKTGQPLDAISRRYASSMAALDGGHGGEAFRAFCDTSYAIFSVFTDDSPLELERSYQLHGHLHFLRMLSYDEPESRHVEKALASLDADMGDEVTILDYGCGLAHSSRALARHLFAEGRRCMLYLADLPTCRFEFLEWEARQQRYETVLLRCGTGGVYPVLPHANIIFASEVLEHVHAPETYLAAFHQALEPGGVLVGDLSHHAREFMHVSPDLSGLADQLRAWGYREIMPACWQKPRPADRVAMVHEAIASDGRP